MTETERKMLETIWKYANNVPILESTDTSAYEQFRLVALEQAGYIELLMYARLGKEKHEWFWMFQARAKGLKVSWITAVVKSCHRGRRTSIKTFIPRGTRRDFRPIF